MRTLVDIPEQQIQELAAIAAVRKVSRAELVREALDAYIQRHRATRESAFGLWREDPGRETHNPQDGLAYQERLRSEW
jgi:hypothetical protein